MTDTPAPEDADAVLVIRAPVDVALLEIPEPEEVDESLCEGLPGDAEPLPDDEPDEPTSYDYDEEVEDDG